MIQKTKNYDMFIFRKDNRAKVDKEHVKRLISSIESRNMLELRPIVVNERMEIIDGQHRLLAAKNLGVEIYYRIEKNLEADDIIKMNIAKSWFQGDYLNFYVYHGYEEYKKLDDFMKKHNLTLKVALNIALGQSKQGYTDFKDGKFKFDDDSLGVELDICWATINYIKKMNGYSVYTESSRFWKALLALIKHPCFIAEKWMLNLNRMVSNCSAKASTKEYITMLTHIYNWRNNTKIDLSETKENF